MKQLDFEAENNPLIVADEIGYVVADGLADGSVSLRSAFLLNFEALRIKRMAYHQPSWNYSLTISGLIALYMQRLVALAAGEKRVAEVVADWLQEDAPMLREKRTHYLATRIVMNPTEDPPSHILDEMSHVRSRYDELPEDDGPYHTEVFPYEYYSPEEVLRSSEAPRPFEKRAIEPAVEHLLVALGAGKWG